MLRQDQRWVSHCLLTLRPKDTQADSIPLERILPELRRRIIDGSANMLMERDSVAFGATRVYLSKKRRHVTFLFQAYDNRAADPGFGKFTNFTVRYARKEEDEGGAAAAQLVVSLDESSPGNCSHFALLETVPGISRTRIERLLTAVAKDISSQVGLTYESPTTGKELQNRPVIRLNPRPSLTLRNALQTGVLRDVSLVKTQLASDGLDEKKWIQDAKEELTFKIREGATPRIAMRVINKIVKRGRDKSAQTLDVRVKHDKRITSLEIDLAESSPADALLIKHDLIELSSPHSIPRTWISPQLRSRMADILEEARLRPLGGK